MPLTRLRFTNTDDSNAYQVPINPSQINLVDSFDANIEDVIDGSAILLQSNQDNRVRSATWDSFPESNTVMSGIRTQLKSFKGLNKKLHLGSLDINALGFKKILVTDVNTTSPRGGDFRIGLSFSWIYTEDI